MQPSCWFVENIERPASRSATQFSRKLNTLGFATAEGSCWLAQARYNQGQRQRVSAVCEQLLECFQRTQALASQVISKDIADRLVLIMNFERFTVITLAMTNFTGHIHVGQEMHFDLNNTVTGTVLTASTFDVETKSARRIAA